MIPLLPGSPPVRASREDSRSTSLRVADDTLGTGSSQPQPRLGRVTSKWIVSESRDPAQTQSLAPCCLREYTGSTSFHGPRRAARVPPMPPHGVAAAMENARIGYSANYLTRTRANPGTPCFEAPLTIASAIRFRRSESFTTKNLYDTICFTSKLMIDSMVSASVLS